MNERNAAARALTNLIRRVVSGMPLVRQHLTDTGQDPITSPTVIVRTDDNASRWLLWYKGTSDVTPDADTPAWTKHATGTATGVNAADLLTTTAAAGANSIFYSYQDATTGKEIEAKLQITSSGTGLNTGACLALWNGTWQFVVWLRATGLNIDGQAEVAIDLSTDAHRVRLQHDGATCHVWVDGAWQQSGGPANATALEGAAFGSWVDKALT